MAPTYGPPSGAAIPDGTVGTADLADGAVTAERVSAEVRASLARADAAIPTGVTGIVDLTGLLGPVSRTPPRTPPTIVTSFQSGHGWTTLGTGVTSNLNDTTDYILGSQSASVTSNGSGAAANIRKTGVPNADLSASTVRLLIKVDGIDNLASLSLYVGDTGFTNHYVIPIYSPGDSKSIVDGEWQWLEVGFANAEVGGGSPNRATVTAWQLRFTDDSAAAVTVHVNAVGFVPDQSAFPNGVVSITFDDTLVTQRTVAAPLLDRYGFAASAMTIADQVGADADHLSLAQLRELRELHGWEVAGHAYTATNHNAGFSSLSESALDNELRALKTWLCAYGFGSYDYLAYPRGEFSPLIERYVGKYFSAARTIAAVPMQMLPSVNPYRLRSKTVANTTDTSQLTGLVDAAYANKGWLLLTFHSVVATADKSTEYSTANFTTVVDYIASKGIPVRTVGEVLSSVG